MWDFPLFPQRASVLAGKVDALYFALVGITVFFTGLICLLIVTFGIRYRRGSRADRSNPSEHNVRMEAVWIGGPLILLMGIFWWAANLFFEIYDPPSDAAKITVVGKQWMWKLQHPEGKSEINELHVPLGRAVRLDMISQDVIHSFYVPEFRVKQDVLPGRYTTLWFEPNRVGTYRLFCAEYCGMNHSRMVGSVYVMEPSDYQRWLSEGERSPGLVEEGARLFQRYYCTGCHGTNSVARAPHLEGVYGRPVPVKAGDDTRWVMADEQYIRDSILLPKKDVVAGYDPIMPSFEGQIPEDELLKIIAYIKSLGQAGEERGER